MREYHTADAVVAHQTSRLGEGESNTTLKEPSDLGLAFHALSRILHDLPLLRREWIVHVVRIRQDVTVPHGSLQPNKEEVRQMRVRDRVIVRRVGEDDCCTRIRKASIGGIQL